MINPLARYSRQMLFPSIGPAGQHRLSESCVLIVGCGALGTVQAEILCRAGVGTLRLVDRDFVEESNLQRQTLFSEEDAKKGLPKPIAAQQRLKQINASIRVEAHVTDVDSGNIEGLAEGAHCILDATDNFETRFLVNDVSVKHGIPWVYGAAVGSRGVSMSVVPTQTPCLRCIFGSVPATGTTPTCDTDGVLAPIVTIVASYQSVEAIKILTGNLGQINRKLSEIDVWENSWKQVEIASAKDSGGCRCCDLRAFDFLGQRDGSLAAVLCGRNSIQIRRLDQIRVDLPSLAQRLKRLGGVQLNEFLLRFQVDQYEIAVFSDGRGIVRGTGDPKIARSLFARYIGA